MVEYTATWNLTPLQTTVHRKQLDALILSKKKTLHKAQMNVKRPVAHSDFPLPKNDFNSVESLSGYSKIWA